MRFVNLLLAIVASILLFASITFAGPDQDAKETVKLIGTSYCKTSSLVYQMIYQPMMSVQEGISQNYEVPRGSVLIGLSSSGASEALAGNPGSAKITEYESTMTFRTPDGRIIQINKKMLPEKPDHELTIIPPGSKVIGVSSRESVTVNLDTSNYKINESKNTVILLTPDGKVMEVDQRLAPMGLPGMPAASFSTSSVSAAVSTDKISMATASAD